MKKYILVLLILIFFVIVIVILPRLRIRPTATEINGKLTVTASFYPLYFFASQIGGDKALVKNLTPAGAEPHDFEPTAKDISSIENSNLLILNGGVEAWGDNIKNNLKDTNTIVLTAGDSLFTQQLNANGQTSLDPHIWLSPPLAKIEVERIVAGYKQANPVNSSYYDANGQKLETELDQLDHDYQTGLKSCEKRDFITSHEAFAYLAKQYGLNQIPIAGLSPDAEPSSQQLAQITQIVQQQNINYIFVEKLVSPKLAQTIAGETGAQTLVLDPLEGLSSTDMNAGKDYFTVMEHNLHNLQIALQCSK